MKTISKLLFIIFLGITSLNQLFAQWVQTNIPIGGLGTIVTFSGTKLFAVSYVPETTMHFYASTDNGATWTIAGQSGERGPMALAGEGTNIFAGYFFANGLYLSTNNGIEWNPVSNFPSTHWITGLAIKGNNVLVGTMNGEVHFSPDNGLDWTSSKLSEFSISSFIFSGSNIFAASSGAGVFRSTVNGSNWVPVNNGLIDSVIITSLLDIEPYILCGTSNGVFLSSNMGSNWVSLNNGLSNDSISSLAASGSNIFAGTYGDGVYLLTNKGSDWVQINEGLTSEKIYSLTVGSDYIFAGTADGVWRRPLSDIITDVEDRNNESPTKFTLEQNYPNPFNPITIIRFALPVETSVNLKIYDILGNEITTLVDEYKPAGSYSIQFDGGNLSSGIYFYKIKAGNFSSTRKLVLMK